MVNSPFLCTFVPVYHARGYSYRKIKRATRSGGSSRNIRHKKEGARGSFFYFALRSALVAVVFALAFSADADDGHPCQRCQAQGEQCASVCIVAGSRCILVVRFIRGGRGGCARRAWGCRMTWRAWARWAAWVGLSGSLLSSGFSVSGMSVGSSGSSVSGFSGSGMSVGSSGSSGSGSSGSGSGFSGSGMSVGSSGSGSGSSGSGSGRSGSGMSVGMSSLVMVMTPSSWVTEEVNPAGTLISTTLQL